MFRLRTHVLAGLGVLVLALVALAMVAGEVLGAGEPKAVTGPVSSAQGQRPVTVTGTLNGGSQPSSWHFEFYYTSSSGSPIIQRTPVREASASGDDQSVSAELIGAIASGQTYFYRLVVTNPSGTSYGEYRTFTTPSVYKGPPPPFMQPPQVVPPRVVPPGPAARSVVPRLKGRTLRVTRRLLRRAHLRLGRVRPSPRSRPASRRLRVRRSTPRAGARVRPGTRVNVWLTR